MELTESTRELLKTLSKAMLRLHKKLLEQAKEDYEARNGKISSVNVYFQLVIDDPHFAWLRKLSSLVALIDEATSLRRPASEEEAVALVSEAEIILNFQDQDQEFNDRFQSSLALNRDAVIIYNETIKLFGSDKGE